MFGIHNSTIKEILNLALLKEETYNKEAEDGLHHCNMSDFTKYLREVENFESTKIDEKLNDILNELDEQTLLCVQTVMYLGRDYNANEGITPLKAYELMHQHLESLENDKNILINMMTEKLPFGSYLQKGLNLLNVNL